MNLANTIRENYKGIQMSRFSNRWFRKKANFHRNITFTRDFIQIREPLFRRKLFSRKRKPIMIGLLGIAILFFILGLKNWPEKKTPVITIQVNDTVIKQGQNAPDFDVSISCSKDDMDTRLTWGYKVSDLVEDLMKEDAYEVQVEGDIQDVGTHKVLLKLNKTYQKWEDKIRYRIEPGVLTVEERMIDRDRPTIAITFDDGPGKYTEDLIRVLSENDARATFFMLGQQVKKYPKAVEAMLKAGCELGNHSYSHKKLTEADEDEIITQIENTNQAISDVVGQSADVVRPPYGAADEKVKDALPYPLILWSVDTLDWKTKNTDSIVDHVMKNVKDGDIVLFHDIYDTTYEAIKQLLPALKEQGYQFVTVRELAELKGGHLENGTKYFKF